MEDYYGMYQNYCGMYQARDFVNIKREIELGKLVRYKELEPIKEYLTIIVFGIGNSYSYNLGIIINILFNCQNRLDGIDKELLKDILVYLREDRRYMFAPLNSILSILIDKKVFPFDYRYVDAIAIISNRLKELNKDLDDLRSYQFSVDSTIDLELKNMNEISLDKKTTIDSFGKYLVAYYYRNKMPKEELSFVLSYFIHHYDEIMEKTMESHYEKGYTTKYPVFTDFESIIDDILYNDEKKLH